MAAMKLHRLGFLLGEAGSEPVRLAYEDLLQAQVDGLTTLVDETLKVVGKVTADTGLNKRGVVEKLQAIGNASRDKIRQVGERARKPLEADLDKANQGLPTTLPIPGAPPITRDDIAASTSRRESFLDRQDRRFEEIRRILLANSEKGLVEAELLSGAADDIELLLAIQEAPKFIRDKLVHPDVFEKAKTLWLEKNMPKQFQQLSTVQQAISLFEHNQQQADKTIANATHQPLRSDVPDQASLERSLTAAATG